MRLVLVFCALVAAAGCGGKAEVKPEGTPAQKDFGTQVGDAGADTKTLADANAAASEVVRAAGDCDAVKAALPEAQRKLDEIGPNVRTQAGRVSFEVIRKRVNDIAQMCP
jgi:hypothetical protein